jgi:hypothetical protein
VKRADTSPIEETRAGSTANAIGGVEEVAAATGGDGGSGVEGADAALQDVVVAFLARERDLVWKSYLPRAAVTVCVGGYDHGLPRDAAKTFLVARSFWVAGWGATCRAK